MSSSFAFEVEAWPRSPCARYFTTPRSPAGKMSVRPRPRRRPISAVQRPTPRSAARRAIASSSESGARISSESSPPAKARAISRIATAFERERRKRRSRGSDSRGQRLGRRKRDVGLLREARPAAVGLAELAADVVGELEVDLLRQDGGHERLPQRRHARDAEPAKRPDRRAEDRIAAMRAIERRDGGRSAERTMEDPARGFGGGLGPGPRAFEAAPRSTARAAVPSCSTESRTPFRPIGRSRRYTRPSKRSTTSGKRVYRSAVRASEYGRSGTMVKRFIRDLRNPGSCHFVATMIRAANEEDGMRFLLRLLINAVALWVAVKIVPGISFTGDWLPFLGVALIFGIVNAFIRPIVKLFTLPIIFLTLGLFALVVNGLMLWLTSWLSTGLGFQFHVEGCLAAILGALVVSVVSALLSMVLPGRGLAVAPCVSRSLRPTGAPAMRLARMRARPLAWLLAAPPLPRREASSAALAEIPRAAGGETSASSREIRRRGSGRTRTRHALQPNGVFGAKAPVRGAPGPVASGLGGRVHARLAAEAQHVLERRDGAAGDGSVRGADERPVDLAFRRSPGSRRRAPAPRASALRTSPAPCRCRACRCRRARSPVWRCGRYSLSAP